jgi:hypothetical protein
LLWHQVPGVSMLHVFRAIDKNRDGRLDLRELQGG